MGAGKQLSFISNVGQVLDQYNRPRNDIQFSLAACNGLNIFVGNNSIHYQFSKTEKNNKTDNTHDSIVSATNVTMYRLDVELVGANKHAQLIKEQPRDYCENYILPGSGASGIAAHAFDRIVYKDVYPAIDWVLYTTGGKLKHEFIVHKGGNVRDIRLKYSGATKLKIDNEGGIIAETPQGIISEKAPYTFEKGGRQVASSFKLEGNMLSYETGYYEDELVIDPSLGWSSYYGGSGTGGDEGHAILVDGAGNIYLAGYTNSPFTIATIGAHQSGFAGNGDGFLVKFNSSGTRLWSTYYGGINFDIINSLAIDVVGNIYATGRTSSINNIASPGAHQTVIGGGNDAFLVKFNSAGVRQWGTYYGGIGNEDAFSVAVDGSGNVFMAGDVGSTTGMTTAGAHQETCGGGTDALLVKFNSSGVRQWATYYGGGSSEDGNAVAVDSAGNVYLAGFTQSSTGISTPGSFRDTYVWPGDGYLVKFNSAGVRQWGTYYGGLSVGPFTDQVHAIAVDGAANVYLAGQTSCMVGFASPGAHQTTSGGDGDDGFLAKFTTTGAHEWSTYYGGEDYDKCYSVAVDGSGNVYLEGYTQSTTGISTPGSPQPVSGGSFDAFLAKFSSSGVRQWATYLGGTGVERGSSVTTDNLGRVYTAGLTTSASGVATPGAYQTIYGGSNDAFFTMYNDVAPITGTLRLCAGTTTTLSCATTGGTWNSGTPSVATVDGTSGLVSGLASGTSIITYTSDGSWVTVLVTVDTSPAAGTISGMTTTCPAATTTLSNSGGDAGGVWTSVTTANATIGASSGIVTGVAAGTSTISYTVTNSCGTAAATSVVTVNPLPNAGAITGTATVCPTATTTLSDATGDGGGVWTSANPAVATVELSSGIVTGNFAGTSTISYTVANSCGSATTTIVVTVNPSPNAGTIAGTAVICATATTTLSNAGGDAGGAWSSSSPAIATVDATSVVTGATAGTSTISYTVTNSCGTEAATMVVTVNPLPNAGTITGTAVVCPTATATLSNATGDAGGDWSSFSTAIATVDAGTGIVTGATPGTSTISYTVTNSCGTAVATEIVTVNPSPNAGTIIGTATVCPTASTTLSNPTGDPGGVWTSASTTTATIGVSSGIVTGVTAGTATISYTVTNSCGPIAATRIVTVNPLPNAGTITGTATVCPTSTTTLSNATGDAGGTWSSFSPAIATVGAGTGIVTGATVGTSTVSYTVTNRCGTAVTTRVVTVNPLPNAGTITGATTVCPTATITLSDVAGGGVWSSSVPARATVNATGVVTGVSAGTTTISYSVTNSCGTAIATKVVTVNPSPNPGAITGTASVCLGFNTTLSDAAPGGIWSSTVVSVATISVSGVVNGLVAGTSTISYTVTNSCGTAAATRIVTVNPLPAAISGSSYVCESASTAMTDSDPGGNWSTASSTISIGASTGVTLGVSAGTALITYTLPTTCLTTKTITVNPQPATFSVTGGGSYCVGGAGVNIGLAGTATGIDYQLYNGATPIGGAIAGTGSTIDFGLITPAGTYTVQATNVVTSCTRNMSGSATIIVNPYVAPSVSITHSYPGTTTCNGVFATFTAVPTNGGPSPSYQWYVNGIAVGSATNSYGYVPANGDIVSVTLIPGGICVAPATAATNYTVSVSPIGAPTISISCSPASPICAGTTVLFTSTTSFAGTAPTYLWLKNGVNVATGSTYSYIPSNGDVILCKLVSNYVCRTSDVVSSNTITMTVQPNIPGPVVNINAMPGTVISAGQSVTFSATATGGSTGKSYQWSINGTPVSGATSSTFVSNTLTNGNIVTCRVTNNDACANSTDKSVTIYVNSLGVADGKAQPLTISIHPNPNQGTFIVEMLSDSREEAQLIVTNILGQVIKQLSIEANKEVTIHLDTPGMYFVSAITRQGQKSVKVVVQ
jgi:hypothetical protein